MIAKNIKCPYYNCETQKYNILCGSKVPPAIQLAYKFPTLTEKLRHRREYCTTYDYCNCPLFFAIGKNYE